MQNLIVPVLALSFMFTSSGSALAATKNTNYWNYQFTSSKNHFAVAPKPATETPRTTKNKSKTVVATAPATPAPTPAPSPAPTPTTPAPIANQCTTGWYITGYFTPVESDYTGATQTVTVKGSPYTFNAAFLKEVQTEGWGKTSMGKYIGYYSNAWHFASSALDAKGNSLSVNTVAIDPALVSFSTKLQITTLPEGYGTKTFTATDIGTGVQGKHIDVYTGEGKTAEAMTYKITGNNNTVCVTQ